MEALTQKVYTKAYRENRERVYRICRSKGISHQDAQDLTQDVFLYLWRDRQRFDPQKGTLTKWINGIFDNVLKMHWRKQYRKKRINESLWQTEWVEKAASRNRTGGGKVSKKTNSDERPYDFGKIARNADGFSWEE